MLYIKVVWFCDRSMEDEYYSISPEDLNAMVRGGYRMQSGIIDASTLSDEGMEIFDRVTGVVAVTPSTTDVQVAILAIV